MIYLLDTHYMLWAIPETKKISSAIKEVMTNPEHRIVVSAVSFWEVSLKSAIGKLHIEGYSPEDFPVACLQVGFEIESLRATDSSTYHQLRATYHKDPGYRLLIWQAIRNDYILISVDANVRKYKSEGLRNFVI